MNRYKFEVAVQNPYLHSFFISHFLTVPQKSKVKEFSGTLPYNRYGKPEITLFFCLVFNLHCSFPSGRNLIQSYSTVMQSQEMVIPFIKNLSLSVL